MSFNFIIIINVIKDATPVKVSADASLVFPLIVSQTFLKEKLRKDQVVDDINNNNTDSN